MTLSPMRRAIQTRFRHTTQSHPQHARTTVTLTNAAVRCTGAHRTDAPRAPTYQTRHLADVRDDRAFPEVWFTGSFPKHQDPVGLQGGGPKFDKSPNKRTVKLGKTIETLHERLPTLLTSPLPTEILSPQITLHLFPTTHPHLPTVSGRIAYSAALWTAPVAWGRVPVVGNVHLIIISERVVKNGAGPTTNHSKTAGDEKLVVRWKTCGKGEGRGLDTLFRGLYGRDGTQVSSAAMPEVLNNSEDKGEFSGLFIFEFDEEGRLASHTIEHAQQGGNWEKTTRVVNVTDWLLGRAGWVKKEPEFALEVCEVLDDDPRRRFERRRRGDG